MYELRHKSSFTIQYDHKCMVRTFVKNSQAKQSFSTHVLPPCMIDISKHLTVDYDYPEWQVDNITFDLSRVRHVPIHSSSSRNKWYRTTNLHCTFTNDSPCSVFPITSWGKEVLHTSPELVNSLWTYMYVCIGPIRSSLSLSSLILVI